MSLALGDINAAVLNGIADKLGTIVGGVGPMEQQVLGGIIQQLSDHASALEKQTAADGSALVTQIESAISRQIDRLNGATVTLGAGPVSPYGFTLNVPPATASTAGTVAPPASAQSASS